MYREMYRSAFFIVTLPILIGFFLIMAIPDNVRSQDSSNTLQDLQNQFQGQPVEVQKSSDKINLTLHKAQNGVVGGSSFELLILLTIEDGWHINAHKPFQSYLIGTSFELSGQQNFRLKQSTYPKAQLLKFGFSDDILKVYEGETPIFISLQAPANLQTGSYILSGSLDVQVCNNSVCLKPSSLPVSLPVDVVGHENTPKIINQELFEQYRL